MTVMLAKFGILQLLLRRRGSFVARGRVVWRDGAARRKPESGRNVVVHVTIIIVLIVGKTQAEQKR